MKGAAGIMGDPERVVKEDDNIIFLSRTSNPQSSGQGFDRGDFKGEAGTFADTALRASAEAKEVEGHASHVLLCGWRPEWTNDVSYFQRTEKTNERTNDSKKTDRSSSIYLCVHLCILSWMTISDGVNCAPFMLLFLFFGRTVSAINLHSVPLIIGMA